MSRAVEDQIADFRAAFTSLADRLRQTVIGQDRVLEQLLTALVAGGHALLEGAPGLGKTLTVRTLADALGLDFRRIQFTPDLMPADITGTHVVTESGGQRDLKLRKGPVFANLVLADEINRATPKTQSALLEAMQEGAVTLFGERHALPAPFFVLATQNPIEMEGTYPLPEAQLDRFVVKIDVPYPDEDALGRIVDATCGPEESAEPAPSAGAPDLLAMRRLARQVVLAPEVRDAASRTVLATHPDQPSAPEDVRRYVRYGSSPRGAQALVWLGKVRALSEGLPHVGFRHLKEVAPMALRHRLILNFEAEADGVAADALVAQAVAVGLR